LIPKIEEKLDTKFWHYILWDPAKKTMINSKTYAKLYLMYHLDIPLTPYQLKTLQDYYKKQSGDLKLNLPSKVF
jgi:hypothetical protein